MAALGIEQNKAQSELKQAALERQQHSVIQALACAPQHCVYICNLTYPLGSHKPTPPFLLPAPCSLLSLSPPCLHRFFSLSRSHHHVMPFFCLLNKDIVKKIRPRAFSQ